MKTIFLIFGVFFATVHASVITDPINEMYDRCTDELTIKGVRPTSQCVSACVKEKKGFMVDGKFLVEKYVAFYMEAFPEAKEEAKATLTNCLRKANKYTDKCKVNDVLHKCENENSDVIYK